MKKYIAIILAMVMFAGLACGCADTGTSTTTTPETKKETALKEVDPAQFPDATEYDIYAWPAIGIASEIPVPVWSNRGLILYETADCFECYVGYTTKDDFNNYVKELQDFGFVKYYQSSNGVYYAETEDGWAVIVTYSQTNSMMALGVARDFNEMGLRDPVEDATDAE